MSEPYPSIDTIWKRDMAHKGRIIPGSYSTPELAYLTNTTWTGSEKVDGCNIRIHWPAEPRRVHEDGSRTRLPAYGGRTDNAQIPTPLLSHLQELFDGVNVDAILPQAAGSDLTLYGEGYGARIQKSGGNYSPTPKFALFDVRVGSWWLERPNIEEVAAALHLEVVPLVYEGNLEGACDFVQSGFLSTFGKRDFPAEGLVLKPTITLLTRSGTRIITKIKARDYR